MNTFFNEADCKLLGSLTFDEDSEIVFASYTHSIYWLDEYSGPILREIHNFRGYQSLFHQRARLFFNRDLGDDHLGESVPLDEEIWQWTNRHIPSWIGFKRTNLKPEEIEAIKRMKREGLT